jgi:hypothetical protein
MTLRMTIEIIPQGDEEAKRVIETLDISNLRDIEQMGFGHVLCEYSYKFSDSDKEEMSSGRMIFHDRKTGARELVRRVSKRHRMKKIETLVEDIYGLFSSDGKVGGGFKPSEDDIEVFGKRLGRHLSNRIAEERGEQTLRLSNLGTTCNRKLWYSINAGDRGEVLSPETRFKFLIGDLLEELLLFLAEQAGHKVEGQQDEVSLFGVPGHRDAIIDNVLVDVKSCSSYSWIHFNNHLTPNNDAFGYITQLQGYLAASGDENLDKSRAAFLAVDKTLGKLCLDIHPKRNIDFETVVSDKREMLSQSTPPPRAFEDIPDGSSGNRRLGVELLLL